LYQRITLHKYLTSEMSKFEFFLAHNQWGYDLCHYPTNVPIRMRKGVVARYNNLIQDHNIYHMSCIERDHPGFAYGGFTHALLTCEARNTEEFLDLIIDNPSTFFCNYCEGFLYDTVEHFSGKAWEIPSEDVWPSCETLVQSCVLYRSDEQTYVELHVHQLIAVVSPQAKKRKIATNEQ